MLLFLPIILLRISFKLYLLFQNYSQYKPLNNYLLSTQYNIYHLKCARIGPLQHLKLSWTHL